MKSSVSAPSASRKYSATVSPVKRDAETGTWGLGHLSVDECGFRFGRLAGLDDARLRHFQPQIVALTGALADAREHRESTVVLGDVVDQFHDDDGLADASAPEQSDLAALQERLDKIDDLDSGFEHLGARRLLVESGGETVNRHSLFVLDRAELIDRLADHVHHATQCAAADGNRNRSALIDGLHAAHHAVGGLHGDTAHATFSQVLLHFENDADRTGHGEAVAHNLHGLIDGRQLALGELYVDRGARDLDYMSYVFRHKTSAFSY